jgi:hypothetical protein
MPNDPKFTISGTVFEVFKKDGKDEKKALAKATVRAENKDLGTQVDQTTGDDGSYSIGPLAQGEWTLSAWLKGYKKPEPQTITLDADKTAAPLELTPAFKGAWHDQKMGETFFWGLIVALAVLAIVYIGLHARVRPTEGPLNATMLAMVTQAQEQATSEVEVSANTDLAFTVAEIKGTWHLISATVRALGDQDKELVTGLVAGIEESIKGNAKDQVVTRLATLHRLVKDPPAEGFFWQQEPWEFVEVLLWGLAGVLISLIVTTGRYLFRQSFWPRGLYMHISQIIGVPLMALVFVWLLSKTTLSLVVAGNQVQLDLSEPRILAAVSFVIGSRPWILWGFITQTAETLLNVAGAEGEQK